MKKKHYEVRRYKTYEPGDFYLYRIQCSCGKEFGGWTPQEAEEEFEKHLNQNKK